jgi:copper transport protein
LHEHRSRVPGHRGLVAAVLALAGLLGVAGAARAHAELVTASPPANAVLSISPTEVTLTFSERIDPGTAFIDLLDPSQRGVDGVGHVSVTADGLSARASLPELEPGVYTVSYQVISAVDGHATTGILAFLVDPAGTEAPPAEAPSSTTPAADATAIIARWIGLAAALVALGSLVLWWNAGRPALRDIAPGAATGPPWPLIGLAGVAAAGGMSAYLWRSARPIIETVGLQGGLPFDPAAPFGWTPFALAMRLTLVASLGLALLAGWAIVRRSTAGIMPAAGMALAAGALAGMSLAGHVSAGGGAALASVDWAHLVAVAAWLGGIPAAFLLARRGRSVGVGTTATGAAILRRHGPMAIVAAPIVALTGIANSPVVLGSGRDLAASGYGNLVLAKAGLLAVAVGIGAMNHVALRRGRGVLGALVAVELAVAALAVGAAATMVTIPPAASRQETLVSAPVNPAHLFGVVGPSSAHLTVNVPSPGPQGYQASIFDRETGAPREDVQRVYLDFMPPAASGLPGPERVELAAASTPGLYGTTGAFTPIEGDWTVDLVVRRSGALDESVSFVVPVVSAPPPEVVPAEATGIEVPAVLGMLWPLLPDGPLGWLPVVAGLIGLALVARSRFPDLVRWTAGGVLVGVVLLAGAAAGSRDLLAAANAPPTDLEPLAVPSDAAAIDRGERLYLANCASCHGRDGTGGGPVRTLPPAGALTGPTRSMSAAELGYRIANGVAGTPMPAFAGVLSAPERLDLIAYLRSRWADD